MTHHQRYSLPQPAQQRQTKSTKDVLKLSLVGVFVLVSVLILANALINKGDDANPSATGSLADQSDGEESANDVGQGPQPAQLPPAVPDKLGELPPGGAYTEKGSGDYRVVGKPGAKFGKGTERTYTYVVEVEDTIDAANFGGGDAFAAMIDATLSNPKSWIRDERFAFEHVDANKVKDPDFRFQLSRAQTTHEVCGNNYQLETSCFYPIGDRVMINESRWVRGATPYEGDLGGYRQYVINHELGHGIGYEEHQPCDGEGNLAPVMMQQTLSLKNSDLYGIDPNEVYKDNNDVCRPNPWPYPRG